METKHTKWYAHPMEDGTSNWGVFYNQDTESEDFETGEALYGMTTTCIAHGLTEADAKLIASAQELLEALIKAEEFVNRHSEEWYESGQALLSEIRETIKATK